MKLLGKIFPIASCKDFEEFVLAYQQKDLGLYNNLNFKLHMAICSRCKKYYTGYLNTIALSKQAYKGEGAEVTEAQARELVEMLKRLER